MKFGCLIGILRDSAHLICQSTDISKCFRGSLGFRDNESQLYLLNSPFGSWTHDLTAGLDRLQQVDAILLHFSKAFDKVPHHHLAVMLHPFSISNKNLSWIQIHTDRNKKIVFDVKTASPAAVTSGVLQASVLGLLLFLVCINALPLRVSFSA